MNPNNFFDIYKYIHIIINKGKYEIIIFFLKKKIKTKLKIISEIIPKYSRGIRFPEQNKEYT
jgi:hypothetical protein